MARPLLTEVVLCAKCFKTVDHMDCEIITFEVD